ncbi:hypothetical protein A3709_08455 [Halioglobus sp. HI00S01]|uniref:ligand-binding sensor domain-containing protein n=1 Tax=Halioglobus sp. HI00S01 TaxID=1822214 RepID=UPI0007C36D87|nr:triple tyrosine motif-containing protein [Halioglobus sp. HI00S01]KZX55020.1 hypothetical protein A3709_08455 [Halioglobus sp. HI00S01]
MHIDLRFLTLIAALFLGASGPVYSNYQIVSPTFAKQIAQPTITSLHQDSMRNLWIGTQEGLYKFDGSTLFRFQEARSKEGKVFFSDIRGISESNTGDILVAAYGIGLVSISLKNHAATIVSHSTNFDLTNITSVSKDETSQNWITTRTNVFKLKGTSKLVQVRTDALEQRNSFEIVSITHTQTGNTFIGGSFGLAKFFVSGNSFEKLSTAEIEQQIVAISEGPENSVIVADRTGQISKLSPDFGSTISRIELPEKYDIHIAKLLWIDNTLFVLTNKGIYIFASNLKLAEVIRAENTSLGNDSVMALLKTDSELWIGTYQGLYAATKIEMELHSAQSSGIHPEVLAFTKDSSGELWIGTYNGLFRLDESGFHERFDKGHQNALTDHRIMTLTTIGESIWVGYQEHGIDLIDTNSGFVERPLPTSSKSLAVTSILQSNSGHIWIATYNSGLYLLSNGVLVRDLSIDDASVTLVKEVSDGEIYAVSEKHIYRLSKDMSEFQVVDIKFDGLESAPRILALQSGAGGDLYIGTKDHGLFYVKFESDSESLSAMARAISKENSNTTAYSIEIDDLGRIWTATQKGILLFSPDKTPLRHFLVKDGLQGNDFNFAASFKDDDGNLYFGGVNGYNKIFPQDVSTEIKSPQLRVTSIKSQAIDVQTNFGSEKAEVHLKHDDMFIMFKFSVLDYIAHDSYEYRYRLLGLQEEWVYSGRDHSATYTNLPAGGYRFEIQATNLEGTWSTESSIVRVNVATAPWRTWWAYSCYLILILGVLGILRKLYDAISMKNKALEYAHEMSVAANLAENEMSEHLEFQRERSDAISSHFDERLKLQSDSAPISQSDCHTQSWLIASSLRVLDMYFSKVPMQRAVDLQRFVELAIGDICDSRKLKRTNVVSINKVEPLCIPFEQTPPMTVALYRSIWGSLSLVGKLETTDFFLEVDSNISEYMSGNSTFRACSSVAPVNPDLSTDFQLSALGDLDNAIGGLCEITFDPNQQKLEIHVFGPKPRVH